MNEFDIKNYDGRMMFLLFMRLVQWKRWGVMDFIWLVAACIDNRAKNKGKKVVAVVQESISHFWSEILTFILRAVSVE